MQSSGLDSPEYDTQDEEELQTTRFFNLPLRQIKPAVSLPPRLIGVTC